MLARALIGLLLTMNVGVALWLWLQPEPPARGTPFVARADVPTLVLLSEESEPVDDAGLDDAAEPDAPPEPSPGLDEMVCVEIGPFLTQSDLRRAMNLFTPSAERVQYRETRALASRGYWVYLPAQRSRDAALATARELSTKGLRDYYVVTAGERENTVSLGLFREKANAQKRYEQVRAMGFDAQLQPRSDEIPNYWIDLAVEAAYDWQGRLKSNTNVAGTIVPCR